MSYSISNRPERDSPRGEMILRQLETGAVRGTFQIIPSAAVTEVIGRMGADFVLVDGEHSSISIDRLEDLVRAGDAVRTPVLYRAASSADDLAKILDTGVAGLVVPRVESAAEARAVVRATRFPSLGARGLGPGRAAAFGLEMANVRANANSEVALCLMVETLTGLEAIDEIAATPGFDVIMIGPADLASSLDVAYGDPVLVDAIQRIRESATAAGKHAGIHCTDADDAARRAAEGFGFLTIGVDIAFVAKGAAQALAR